MPTRRTEYGVKTPEGWTWQSNPRFSIQMPTRVILLAVKGANPPKEIADSYWIGTAKHEADPPFTVNERDTEKSGFKTYGVFQVSEEEGARAGVPVEDLPTLEGCARAFVPTAVKNYNYLLPYAKTPEARARDIFAYMAVLHNVGAHDSSIKNLVNGRFPMRWGGPGGFKDRNKNTKWGMKISRYGDDCLPPSSETSSPLFSLVNRFFRLFGGE